MELHLTPQGNLAEKIRAGGAGIPAFYSPTGADTWLESGQIPIKFKENCGNASVEKYNAVRETRHFNG